MTFSLPLFVIAIFGFVAFIITGLVSIIPWVASGPFALPFLGLMIAEVREYFFTVTLKPPSKVYQNVEKVMKSETVSSENPTLRDAVTIEPKSLKKYRASLAEGELLTVKAGADDWIYVELVSLTESTKLEAGKKYYSERGKGGKNLTIQYEAKRNGNWFVYVYNASKTPLEVGVTLTVEK